VHFVGFRHRWTYFATVQPSRSMRELTPRIAEHRLDNQIPLISAYISLLIIDENERQLIVKYVPRCRIQRKNSRIKTNYFFQKFVN
jgi:hypothetical protein